MIAVEGLHFSFDKTPVLRGIDVQVGRGEILGILGPNGCGKSTMLRLMRGALEPSRGSVLLGGLPVREYRRKALARRIAVVPQAIPVPFPYPVREIVAMGRFAHSNELGGFRGLSQEDREKVDCALVLTDTMHLIERPVTQLSGGELQRVILARALAQDTPLLLLDEATSHLDMDHKFELTTLLMRLNREKNLTVVQVSHDVDLVAESSHRLLLLNREGEAVALGTPEAVLNSTTLRKVFGVEVVVEANPFTGRPRILPIVRGSSRVSAGARVHVVCGGGGGAEILRRLHLAGYTQTVGPLNRGDSDQVVARALGIDAVVQEPFCPLSRESLAAARAQGGRCDVLVVAPTPWGPGNVECLELAAEIQSRGTPLLLVDPSADRDFTGGRANTQLQRLKAAGARVVRDVEELLSTLDRLLNEADS